MRVHPFPLKGNTMRKKLIQAFEAGMLTNLIKKASKDKKGDKEEFQDKSKQTEPKERLYIDPALDAVDSLAFKSKR